MRLAVSAAIVGAGLALVAGANVTAAVAADDDPWRPERPITVLVPWPAGGITDQVVRVTAGAVEEALGQTLVVVNQPGASGAIATQAALEAARDGYTWTSGAPHDLGAYPVLGMLDTRIEDWHLFIVTATGTIVSVNADAPWQTLPELLDAMRAEPGAISVATAGVNSSGHLSIETVAQGAGVTYRHVPYDGGNPAVIATVAGETQVTTQLAPEQAEMIRAGRLRPLAVVADEPLEIAGHGTIPSVTEFLPDLEPKVAYTGIFIPRGVPDEVIATLERIWAEEIPESEAIRTWAADRGAIMAPMAGEEAQEKAFPTVQNSAWLYYDGGKAQVSPDTLGIPRP